MFQPAAVTPQESEKVMKQWSHVPEFISDVNVCGQNQPVYDLFTHLSPSSFLAQKVLQVLKRMKNNQLFKQYAKPFPSL